MAQCTTLNLSKQWLDQPVISGCAYLTMTQLNNLTESSEEIKVFAYTANNTQKPLPDDVFN